MPLHSNFFHASNAGSHYDLRKIFNGTLVKIRPNDAVTYVDNHECVSCRAFFIISHLHTSIDSTVSD